MSTTPEVPESQPSPAEWRPQADLLALFHGDETVTRQAEWRGVFYAVAPLDLPEKLKHLEDQLPGFVFPHLSATNRDDTIHQFRPDTPKDPEAKYLFPLGTTPVLSISYEDIIRLESEDPAKPLGIIIQEGTKQAIVAATYAPKGYVVVGIQGCWGWMHDKAPLPGLADLVRNRSVTVIFDADVELNYRVRTAADRLEDHLKESGATKVRFAKVPLTEGDNSDKTGIDDYLLTSVSASERGAALAKIINDARVLNNFKKPNPKVVYHPRFSDRKVIVSKELGAVCKVTELPVSNTPEEAVKATGMKIAKRFSYDDGTSGRLVCKAVLFDALPTILSDITVYADVPSTVSGTPPVVADKSYLVRIEGKHSECIELEIPSDQLKNVTVWVKQLGKLSNTRIGADAESSIRRVGELIALAIKDTISDPEFAPNGVTYAIRVPYVGWVRNCNDDQWYFADSYGAIGPDGKVDNVRSIVDGVPSYIDIPPWDIGALTRTQQAFKNAKHCADDLFVDPTAFLCGLGASCYIAIGGKPSGALMFTGPPSSGKTAISRGVSGLWMNLKKNPQSLENAKSSVASLRRTITRVHYAPFFIDDIRDSQDNSKGAPDYRGITEVASEVGYGGSSSTGTRMQQSSSGAWQTIPQLQTNPFVIMNGEVAPDGPRTIERTFIVNVEKSTSFKPGCHSEFVEITESPTFRLIIAYIINRTTQVIKIKDKNDWDRYQQGIPTELRQQAVDIIHTRCKIIPDHDPRLMEVSIPIIAGLTWFVELGVILGAFSAKEAKDLRSRWLDIACLAIDTYYDRYRRLQDMSHGNIEKLKQLIAAGMATLSDTARPGTPRIGKIVTRREDGKHYVALIPASVKQVLRISDAYAAVSEAVERFDGGNSTCPARINGQSIRCFYLRNDYWTPSESPQADDDHVDF